MDKKSDAVGKYYKDRLGGWKEIKQTIAEDPVGALLDFSGISGIARSVGKNIIKQPYNAGTAITKTSNPKLEAFGKNHVQIRGEEIPIGSMYKEAFLNYLEGFKKV